MARNPNKKKCKATNRKGKPCGNWAKPGYDVCHYHGAGGGAPKQNKNAEKHGLFSKHLPKETMDLVDNIENLNAIDILWDNIKIQYAAIIRSQKIMYVKDREDDDIHTVEKTIIGETPKKEDITVNKLQVITSNERQANFLQSQSRAMATLTRMIKGYEELCKSEMATEEQRLRVEKLRVDIDKVKAETKTESKATKITIVDEWIDKDED